MHGVASYHPVLMEGAEGRSVRGDCESRYLSIREDYRDFFGKKMLDVGCAEGYFCLRFVQDGGASARGVEILHERRNAANKCAKQGGYDVSVTDSIPDYSFDVLLYLDLYFHDRSLDEDVIGKFMSNGGTMYISPSGNNLSKKLYYELDGLNLNPYVVCETEARDGTGRTMYRCDL